MEPQEELSELVGDILVWISQAPSREDILEYLKVLPEDQYETLAYSAYLAIDKAYEKAHADWKVYGIKADSFSVIDEIGCIDALATFNSRSVLLKYQKQYPELTIPNPVPDLSTWAGNFRNTFRTVTNILTAPQFSRRLVDLKTIASYIAQPEKIQAIDTAMTTLYQQDQRVVTASIEPAPLEREEQENLLKSLKLFPDEYITKLTDPVNFDQKAEVVASFLSAIEIIRSFVQTPEQLSPEGLERVLWEYLYAHQQKDVLVYLQVHYQKISPTEKATLDWLSTHFTIANLRSGVFETEAATFFATQGLGNRPAVLKQFQKFMGFSPVAEIVAEPLNVKNILDRLNRNRAVIGVVDMISGMVADIADENRRDLAYKMFTMYLKLTHI